MTLVVQDELVKEGLIMPKHNFRLHFQQFIAQSKNSKLKTIKLGINSIFLLLLSISVKLKCDLIVFAVL